MAGQGAYPLNDSVSEREPERSFMRLYLGAQSCNSLVEAFHSGSQNLGIVAAHALQHFRAEFGAGGLH